MYCRSILSREIDCLLQCLPKVRRVVESLEGDMQLLALTGVEDKLQVWCAVIQSCITMVTGFHLNFDSVFGRNVLAKLHKKTSSFNYSRANRFGASLLYMRRFFEVFCLRLLLSFHFS